MAKRLQEYETEEILVTFAPEICIHSGVCARGLAMQFDLIPADMVQSIEVNKAVTPDLDADAIGASANTG